MSNSAIQPSLSSIIRPVRPIATFGNGKEVKPSNSKKPAYDRREPRFHVLPPFSYNVKEKIALLEGWVKDQVITLPEAH